ncbi:AAA family ATPase [Actinoplanes sp. NPDC024001]|uniref:ATP-binding protein n=1 Tax=Actinoplanes sp. NPDC024001 TaxID=3154598 RepID=UPI0033CF919C
MHQQLFVDRETERAAFDDLVKALRNGESRVLVVHGAPGVGKSALIDYAERAAGDLRVLRAAGVESEMELAFAALHQICLPLLDRLDHLPVPRREALETVFRMRAGTPPDPFLVGLAVLNLLSDASEQQPLLCLVDDTQWLDRASAQVLGFVARRLLAESIGLILGTRQPIGPDWKGLPELEVTGLSNADAHLLLRSATRTRLDQRISDRIVAETHGNPLALIELPRGLTMTQMAGGLGLLDADTLPGRIEESFLNRIRDLPASARTLLLVAAADSVGDPDLVRSAARQLGVPAATAVDDLLTIDERVTFRHPLVRSAVYRAADPADRRAAHLALAEVTDPHTAPERRAWHRAAAAVGPDESVADELEQSAGRAQSRGGLAAAAAFLQRSVALTGDPLRRTERMLAAAEASLRAGEFDDVRRLLRALDSRPLDGPQSGRAGVLEGQIAFASGAGGSAIPLLLDAASRLAPTHPRLARETLLNAWGMATVNADREGFVAVARAVRSVPADETHSALDLVLDGMALLVTEGWDASATTLREAAERISDMPVSEVVRWGWQSTVVYGGIWDFEALRAACVRQVRLVREAGALQALPYNLTGLGYALTWAGEFEQAAAAIAESRLVAEATGNPIPPYINLHLLALRGREAETTELVTATLETAAATGFGSGVTTAHWASALLCNGLARYPEAMRSARAAEQKWEPIGSTWILPELVEAASRAGDDRVARNALERLVATTRPFPADFPAGLEARCRALLAEDSAAEDLYREAIERLGLTRMRPDTARAHLLYGEWLRRRRQRAEAREQLRTAYEMFVSIGMEAFAERARRELVATGESVRKRTAEATSGDELTAQERQIALLVRDGLSNPEVAARLFISPRTVEWHLRGIFAKLAVSSRRQLRDVLPPAEEVTR